MTAIALTRTYPPIFSDRREIARLVGAGAAGKLAIFTAVTDFEKIPLHVRGVMDTRATIDVKLHLPSCGQETAAEDRRHVIFDATPPRLDIRVPHEPVPQGQPLGVELRLVGEEISDVKEIQCGFAKPKEPDKFAEDIMPPISVGDKALHRISHGESYVVEIPSDKLKPGSYFLLVRAADGAGNTKNFFIADRQIEIGPKPTEIERKKPDRTTGTLRAHVFVQDGQQQTPVAGVTVKVTGPVSDTKPTNANGDVVFENIPLGTYALSAEKWIHGFLKKGTGTATLLPTGPDPTVPIPLRSEPAIPTPNPPEGAE